MHPPTRRWTRRSVDLKAFTDDFYSEVCGGRLQTVLDTLAYVAHRRLAGCPLDILPAVTRS